MGIGQKILAFCRGICGIGAVSFVFYRSWTAFGILLVFACIYPWIYERSWRERQLCSLEEQFKEAIQILAGFLNAGYSAENAIAASGRELERLYGVQGMIVKEFRHMAVQMDMNQTVEEVMQEFAERSGLEEAERFSQIFKIAKRSGGQLAPIICHTVSVMEDRSQVKEEIRTMTASVRFEQKVMNVIPFFMILYIDMTSPGFFQVMYETTMGRMIMTGCLAIYLMSLYLSRKLLDIKIA